MPAPERRSPLRILGSKAVDSHIWPKPGQIWGTLTAGKERSLALRGEVAFLCAYLETPVERHQINGTEAAVQFEFRRTVCERILAAQLFLNVMEARRHVFHALGKERYASCSFRHLAQNIIATVAARAHVRTDGVNDCAGALAHLD